MSSRAIAEMYRIPVNRVQSAIDHARRVGVHIERTSLRMFNPVQVLGLVMDYEIHLSEKNHKRRMRKLGKKASPEAIAEELHTFRQAMDLALTKYNKLIRRAKEDDYA